jgi:DNA-3-methyladenine glycosylase I
MPQGKPPPRRRPKDLAGYLETMSRPVFQAGMNRRVVEAKWDGIRDALKGFDPKVVAAFGPRDVDRLVEDPRMIRSRGKIEGVIDNAHAILELDAEYGGFRKYLRSQGDFQATVADLKRQFRYIGDTGAYAFLYMVGEEVPPHEEWMGGRRGRRRASA